MYTQCPECKTTYRIDIGELRAGKGEVLCDCCDTFFNALSSLTMAADDVPNAETPRPAYTPVLRARAAVAPFKSGKSGRQRPEPLADSGTPESSEGEGTDMFTANRRRRSEPVSRATLLRWGGGALALIVLLGVQIAAFEGQRLVQDVYARPLLDRLCAGLGCTLPPFKDLDRIHIVDRALNIAQDGREAFEFRLIFTNQSDLPQAFPQLRLVLNELNGYPVAERVFAPSEYLKEWRDGQPMPVGRPFEVHLTLAKPSKDVGGFLIEFR